METALVQEVEMLSSDLSGSHVTIEIPMEDIQVVDEQIKEEHLEHTFDNIEDEIQGEKLEIVRLKLKEPEAKMTPSKNISGKKRVSLTIEKKIEIIQRHEKGESQKTLAAEFNVGRTTISDILKRKMKFFSFVEQNADKSENLKRRRTLRKTIHKVLEDKVMEWYNQLRDSGAYVSGPMIAQRAQELHKELGYTDSFTASNGWLDRFKVRNGIKLCGLREVKTESDSGAVEPFKAELESLAQWYNLSLEQIYNADETDLFYRMLPNPNDDMNEVKASVRVYRERMTVLCCSNSTGTHKLPLVCIGRGKRSRTFNAHELRSMPVQYYSQETAWMDGEIFENWFHTHFVPSVRQHLSSQGLPEQALLLIDRSASHPFDRDDHNLRSHDNSIFVQYFPSSVKSLIQPMEQGIIQNLKLHYRYDLLTDLITKNLTIPEFYKQFNIKEAIKLIAEGWNKITQSNIQRCFSKIFPAFLEVAQSENEAPRISSFIELISKIPECVDKNYNQERLEFWLACDEAEPIRDRNTLILSLKDEQQMDEDTIKIYETYQDEVPQAIEVIASSEFKNSTDLDEDMLNEETEIDILSQSQHEVIDPMQLKSSDDDFLYEESTNNDVTCEQAIDALDVVLNFMKNDSESRYRDVVFLSELKKKLRRRLDDFVDMKQEKRDFM